MKTTTVRRVKQVGWFALERSEFAPGSGNRRRRRQQQEGIRVLRVVKDVDRWSGFDHLAGVHDAHAVGNLSDDGNVVRDVEDAHAQITLDLLELTEDLVLNDDVESRRRLISDDELRITGQGHGDNRPLPHAARKLVGIPIHHLWIKSNHLEQLAD